MDEFEVIDTIDCDDGRIHYHPRLSIKSINSPDDPGRFFRGILNANTVDRDGERFEPMGVDLKAFKAAGGPVVNQHFDPVTSSGLSNVVGRADVVRAKEGLILKKGEFDTDEVSEHWKGKVHRKFIKALSAGFLRRKAELRQSKRGGEQHVVVTESELIHVALTSQPVNRESLIAAKSIDRIAVLESRLKDVGSDDFLEEVSKRIADGFMGKLSQEIAELSDQVANLSVGRQRDGRDCTTASGLNEIAQSLATLCVDATNPSHDTLPDSAFIIEKGAEYNPDGTVVCKYRHLPHHTGEVENSVSNSAINKALLRNALASVKDVKPVKESAESFRAKAQIHLIRHADAVGIHVGN